MTKKILAMLAVCVFLAGGYGCGKKAEDDTARIQKEQQAGRPMSTRDRELANEAAQDAAAQPAEGAAQK